MARHRTRGTRVPRSDLYPRWILPTVLAARPAAPGGFRFPRPLRSQGPDFVGRRVEGRARVCGPSILWEGRAEPQPALGCIFPPLWRGLWGETSLPGTVVLPEMGIERSGELSNVEAGRGWDGSGGYVGPSNFIDAGPFWSPFSPVRSESDRCQGRQLIRWGTKEALGPCRGPRFPGLTGPRKGLSGIGRKVF